MLWAFVLVIVFYYSPVSSFDTHDIQIFSEAYTNSELNPSEKLYSAQQALDDQASFWRSGGDHQLDDEVIWTAVSQDLHEIKGIEIDWQQAPGLFEILVSDDDVEYRTVRHYTKPGTGSGHRPEIILFDEPQLLRILALRMKNPTNGYFGIRNVKVVQTDDSALMIVSGKSAPSGELCLQAEGGNTHGSGTRVILDSCQLGIESGDGREIWRFNKHNQLVAGASGNLCMTAQMDSNNESKDIVLLDCEASLNKNDGRSVWQLLENSQLRLQSEQPLCMTYLSAQSGSDPYVKVSVSHEASATATSVHDDEHVPMQVFDNGEASFWASEAFSDYEDHEVAYDIDLGDVRYFEYVIIGWEHAPLHYQILLSDDGKDFTPSNTISYNSLSTTRDYIGRSGRRYIRVKMSRPHPILGRKNSAFLYGIRTVDLLSHNLSMIASHCSSIPADKLGNRFFMQPALADLFAVFQESNAAERGVQKTFLGLQDNISFLENNNRELGDCTRTRQHFDELDNIRQTIEKRLRHLQDSGVLAAHASHLPGRTRENPSHACSHISGYERLVPSGFYWIGERHAPARVYCDMETQTSLLLVKPERDIKSMTDIKKVCETVGLHPLGVLSSRTLGSILNLYNLMGYKMLEKQNIPVGYDYECDKGHCSGKFKDLNQGVLDVSISFIAGLNSPSQPFVGRRFIPTKANKHVFIGLDSNGAIVNFNLSINEIFAVPCSSTMTHELDEKLDTGRRRTTLASVESNTNKEPTYNPSVEDLINIADNAVDVNHKSLSMVLAGLRNRVAHFEKLLKPLSDKDSDSSSIGQVYRAVNYLLANLSSMSDSAQDTLSELMEKVNQRVAADSADRELFGLEPEDAIFDRWASFDTDNTIYGPSQWEYVSKANKPDVVGIVQKSSITGLHAGEGSYLLLKDKVYNDFVLRSELRGTDFGTVGIALRVHDLQNMFLFEASETDSSCRFVNVVNGLRSVLEEKKNCKCSSSADKNIDVEADAGSMRILCNDDEVFHLYDETRLSGQVGFFLSGTSGFFIRSVNVNEMEKKQISKDAVPLPPLCAHFKESYQSNFSTVYSQTDPIGGQNPITWKYYKNVYGRETALLSQGLVQDHSEIGSLALLKGNKTCRNGYFSFDFIPNCPTGIIGAVFRYKNKDDYQILQLTPSEARVQRVMKGKLTTMSKERFGYIEGKWQTLSLHFDGPFVTATHSVDGRILGTLSLEDIFGFSLRDGRIGLSSFNCNELGVDNVSLSPFGELPTQKSNSAPIQAEQQSHQPWHPCVSAAQTSERENMCAEMLQEESSYRRRTCAEDFCTECCNWHTSILPQAAGSDCRQECNKQSYGHEYEYEV